jgi:hypothetical protein
MQSMKPEPNETSCRLEDKLSLNSFNAGLKLIRQSDKEFKCWQNN